MEDSVLERLLSRGQTIAVAEVGSGGELAAALCHTELASKVLGGAFVAASEEQLRQLLGVTDALWNGTADPAKLELLATTAAQREQPVVNRGRCSRNRIHRRIRRK